MADIDLKLGGNFEAALGLYETRVQETVLLSGVAAMAKVIYDETVLNASGERQGGAGSPPGRVTGHLAGSIYRVYSKSRSTNYMKTYQISWNKTRAPHGHLIEFGTSRAPAHPFLRPAFGKIEQAIKAGQARMEARLKGGVVEVGGAIE